MQQLGEAQSVGNNGMHHGSVRGRGLGSEYHDAQNLENIGKTLLKESPKKHMSMDWEPRRVYATKHGPHRQCQTKTRSKPIIA